MTPTRRPRVPCDNAAPLTSRPGLQAHQQWRTRVLDPPLTEAKAPCKVGLANLTCVLMSMGPTRTVGLLTGPPAARRRPVPSIGRNPEDAHSRVPSPPFGLRYTRAKLPPTVPTRAVSEPPSRAQSRARWQAGALSPDQSTPTVSPELSAVATRWPSRSGRNFRPGRTRTAQRFRVAGAGPAARPFPARVRSALASPAPASPPSGWAGSAGGRSS